MLPLTLRLLPTPQHPDDDDMHPQLPFLAFETSYGDGDDVVLLFAIMSQRAEPSSTKIYNFSLLELYHTLLVLGNIALSNYIFIYNLKQLCCIKCFTMEIRVIGLYS